MNLKKLESLRYIEGEIQALKEDIEEAQQDYITAIRYTHAGGGTNIPSNLPETYVLRIADLDQRLKEKINEKYKLKKEIYDFLDGIEDPEEKNILLLRFVKRKTLREIGYNLHMDHSTVCRKLFNIEKKYIN